MRRRRCARASHSITRRTTFFDSPARGGSTTTTSGLPGLLQQGPDPRGGLGGPKRAFAMPLRRALCSASAIASATISMPQTSPAWGARHRLIVPIPQKRSKTRSVPLSPARVDRDRRRGAPPSRCWSAGTPRDATRKRRPRMTSSRCSSPSTPVGPSVPEPGPLDHGVEVHRRTANEAGDVTSRVCTCPVRAESRTTRLRSTPVRAARVPGRRSPRLASPARAPRCGRRSTPPRPGGSRPRPRPPPSSRGGGSPAATRPRAPRRTSTRACCGIATARPRARSASSSKPSRSADAPQRLVDLALLLGQLALVGKPLPRRAGAGLAVVDAGVGDRSGEGRRISTAVASAWFAWPSRPGRGRGRPGARRRRTRRSRRRARRRGRPGPGTRRLSSSSSPRMRAVAARGVGGVGVRAHVIRVTTRRCRSTSTPTATAPRRSSRRSTSSTTASRGAQGRPGDRGDLRTPRRAVRPLDGRGHPRGGASAPAATRPAGCGTCSASPSTGCLAARRSGEAEELARLEATLQVETDVRGDAVPAGADRAGERARCAAPAGARAGARRTAGRAAQPAAPQRRWSARTPSAGSLGWTATRRCTRRSERSTSSARPQTAPFLDATDSRLRARSSTPGSARPGCRR